MKKLIFFFALFAAVHVTYAQGGQGGQGGDTAARMARMKEMVKPQLMEKTKLTDQQADKVIEINFDVQRQMREVRMDQNLSDDDKKKRSDEINAARAKRLKEIPLTDDQVKSVTEFFDEWRKQMQQQRGNGGQ
ncbi:MAG: hypothetical protein M3342_24375 [Bacteroidota bacterium]|nr:hypothetical protein [Flavisolibacter sp.]MBD0296639.1 hypothetical protein [Flavisolibacter sp.]MBD0368040.1 hypothetical protein [Flavisolibacter sp.]MBD0378280.1 hypothetical protein [Flavisolibacter sp.]MDQ3847123.1 hypothetical protein [Bacteroidota bacterium]